MAAVSERELLQRALPLLERLGDFIGNGDVRPDRADSLGDRCDLIGDIKRLLAQPEQIPVTVCVRDPDASNDFRTFGGSPGAEEVYDIDLGYADLDNEGECTEWAKSHLDAACNLTNAEAKEYVETIVVEQYNRRREASWPVLRWVRVDNAYSDGVEESHETGVLIPHRDEDEVDDDYNDRVDTACHELTGIGRTDGVGSYYEVTTIDGIEPAIHLEWSD